MNMDFTEEELLELLTAIADQRTYYRQALERGMLRGTHLGYYQGKLKANCELYIKLQTVLMALETSEGL